MKIRSITVFADIDVPLQESQIAPLGEFAREARHAFEAKGTEVQTVRLAMAGFPDLAGSDWTGRPAEFAVALEQLSRTHGFEYVSCGPAPRNVWESLPQILAATDSVFVSIDVARYTANDVDGEAVRAAAQVICEAAQVRADGFANLRFAALANVGPGTPFFPASYHKGGAPSFALATEAADLAVTVCEGAQDAEQARWHLATGIETQAKKLAKRADKLSQAFDLPFGGIDFSLAPFPVPEISVGTALECLCGEPLGAVGSLTAAAVLTDAIDRAQFPRCGFSGLMLPVLEDAILAQRVAEGRISVADLLQWSAVCGTGLDTVPLPGDVKAEALAGLLLDVAALALRLDKPLTARLMPLPGKVAGDAVHFDFDYFTDSRVLALPAAGADGLLGRTTELRLAPTRRHPPES